jgi:hypothetical protein
MSDEPKGMAPNVRWSNRLLTAVVTAFVFCGLCIVIFGNLSVDALVIAAFIGVVVRAFRK